MKPVTFQNYLENIVSYHKKQELFKNDINMEIVINDNLELWKKECLIKSFKDSNILDENNYIKYSLAGWIQFGSSDVLKELIKNSEIFYIKKIWEICV